MSGELAIVGPEPTLPELANQANGEYEQAYRSYDSAIEHLIRCGEALLTAKVKVGHGNWLGWLGDNFVGSEDKAENYMLLAANSERVRNMDTSGLSQRALVKRLRRISREAKAEELRAGEVIPITAHGDVEIRHGDLRTALRDLDSQVDAIITDPPYPLDFIGEFDALGELAVRLLKPTGILGAMVGQSHLPSYIERLSKHLAYRWCGAYLTDGPATRIHDRSVGTKWKPILLFEAGTEQRFLTQDVFSSTADDKRHHDWGQSESGMADLVERLTRPGDLIVDPFLGGGTTALVCRELGRRFVGCDLDAAAVETSRERLAA